MCVCICLSVSHLNPSLSLSLQIIEPGQRWACLMRKEWTTNKTFNLGSGTSFSLRGFQGDYEVLVKRKNVLVQRENFTLGKEAAVWNLDVTNSTGKKDSAKDCLKEVLPLTTRFASFRKRYGNTVRMFIRTNTIKHNA